jgi:hypothetical protein
MRGDLAWGRFLHRLSDGWSASLHLRHAGREQANDLVVMFTGPAGKRKIRLALFANLSRVAECPIRTWFVVPLILSGQAGVSCLLDSRAAARYERRF